MNLLIDRPATPPPPTPPAPRVPGLGPDAYIPFVDQDLDGAPDPFVAGGTGADRQHYAWLNLSPGSLPAAAQSLLANVRQNWPAPDAGYTYPDHNSPFLTFETVEPVSNERFLLPAFHRPQLLRGRTAQYNTTAPLANDWYNPSDWYTNARTLPYVFRPHQERRAVAVDPSNGRRFVALHGLGDGFRFVTNAHPDVDNTGAAVGFGTPGYVPPLDGLADQDGDGQEEFRDLLNLTSEGHWRYTLVPPAGGGPPVPDIRHPYDADPDNDGVYDSVWLDLGYPAQETAGGELFVPMMAVKLVDADALFNLNAHGNAYGNFANLGGSYLSRSNEGLGPHEINPQYGLTATAPTGDPALEPHRDVFGFDPTAVLQLANTEWWFLLAGLGEDDGNDGTFETSVEGRWGEPRLLANALNAFTAVAERMAAAPRPGLTGRASPRDRYADDDDDALAGLLDTDLDRRGLVFPPNTAAPADGFPTDRRGQGHAVQSDPAAPDRGAARLFTHKDAMAEGEPSLQLAEPTGPVTGVRYRFPAFLDYWLPMRGAGFDYSATGPRWTRHVVGGAVLLTQAAGFGDDYAGLMDGDAAAVAFVEMLNLDEPDETVLDVREARKQGSDRIFDPQETAVLALSDRDRSITELSGRVDELAPYNFAEAADAEVIRGRFTTVSSDNHAAAPTFVPPPTGAADPRPAGLRARAWEFNEPARTGGASVLEFPPSFGGTASAGRHRPYWSNTFAGGNRLGLTENTAAPYDPFREELRALLRATQVPTVAIPGTANDRREQTRALFRKLSVNHVLERVTNPRDAYYDADGQVGELRFRPLTPHPAGLTGNAGRNAVGDGPLGTTPLPGTPPSFGMPDAALPAANAATWQITGPADQEWHARRDRQNMARDFYVLLWTLGGFDQLDPTKNYVEYTADPYTDEQKREMAQFAVNLVDALDADSVITAFVYDKNLSNGYTPDDDAYTDRLPQPGDLDYDPTNPPADIAERGVVYGVERQDVVLSESLLALVAGENDMGNPEDHDLTEWDDETPTGFLFVELMNAGPDPENFAAGPQAAPAVGEPGGQWQVVVRQTNGAPGMPDLQERRLTLLDGTAAANRPYFTIGATDVRLSRHADPNSPGSDHTDPGFYPTRMVVNVTDQEGSVTDFSNFVPAAPAYPDARAASRADLDVTAGPVTRFRLHGEDGMLLATPVPPVPPADPPDLLSFRDKTAVDAASNIEVEVLLRRRLNPLRTPPTADNGNEKAGPELQDNPWITVDRIETDLQYLLLNTDDHTDGPSEFKPQIKTVTDATRRRHPMSRGSQIEGETEQEVAAPRNDWVFNSLGGHGRSAGGARFSAWQPHGDRPFGSLADVLAVPLYGPESLTGVLDPTNALVTNTAQNPLAGLVDYATGNPLSPLNEQAVAAARFLYPDVARHPVPSFRDLKATGVGPYTAPTQTKLNLWWRLFQYAEPARHEAEMTRTPGFAVRLGPTDRVAAESDDLFGAGHTRTAGRMNVNTLRDPRHLAGLLDDLDLTHTDAISNNTLPGANGYGPGFTPATADWWQALVVNRDGADPLLNVTGTTRALPGLPPRAFDGTLLEGTAFRTPGSLRWNVEVDPVAGVRRNFSESILRRVDGYDGPPAVPRHRPADGVLRRPAVAPGPPAGHRGLRLHHPLPAAGQAAEQHHRPQQRVPVLDPGGLLPRPPAAGRFRHGQPQPRRRPRVHPHREYPRGLAWLPRVLRDRPQPGDGPDRGQAPAATPAAQPGDRRRQRGDLQLPPGRPVRGAAVSVAGVDPVPAVDPVTHRGGRTCCISQRPGPPRSGTAAGAGPAGSAWRQGLYADPHARHTAPRGDRHPDCVDCC